METMIRASFFITLLLIVHPVSAQTTRPRGSPENPIPITSADLGPEIDPRKLTASPFNSLSLFPSFRSFVSASYAMADVWIYAEGDDQRLYDARLMYPYPRFYRPTWGEVFDHVARQMRCTWDWNPNNRQFRFAPTIAEPFFSVTLAEGWRREDRGQYVWHSPKTQPFGMDIYYLGHYTPSTDRPDLHAEVRAHVAMGMLRQWPHPPTLEDMTPVKLAGVEALYLRCDTPRPGGLWRQWSVVLDGHAFLIVSAMPKENEAELAPQVNQMVGTFRIIAATTQPTRPQ
jgi:hypothetical protein